MDKHENRFHCCATCKHFAIEKSEERIITYCSRLGYETKSNWQFNCWDPKERVRQVMGQENAGKEEC